VNGGGAAARIHARETALRGRDGQTVMGFAAGCSEWGRRREKGAEARQRRPAPFWEGRVRKGRCGSGNWADAWRKRGMSKGGSLSTDGRRPAGSGPRPMAVGDMHRACAVG
jgi:hypothetical protein